MSIRLYTVIVGREVMRRLFVLCVLLFHLPVWAQTTIPEVYFNQAWVDGVYWNANELPGWGFFVDVQEETMFGAVYGYTSASGEPTFITLQGNLISDNPMRFSGDVYSITNGSNVTNVGSFTWEVTLFEASPAAKLTISSNILSMSNLSLIRFSYIENDKIDMFTAANWDMVTRLTSSYADNFGISDERLVDDGITYAVVINNYEPDLMGLVGYFPPSRGDLYSILIEFDSETMEFFVFQASDTEMYGRGWLLDEGEEPTGNGYYFHGAVDTFQRSDQDQLNKQGDSSVQSTDETELDSLGLVEFNKLRKSIDSDSGMAPTAMFSEATVQSAFKKLTDVYDSRFRNGGTRNSAE
jgi:hypothetical protein